MKRATDPPKWIAWEITGRCNLQCIHCRSSSGMTAEQGDMSTGEAIRFIDSLAEYATPVVVLSGGEPLLREDLFSLAAHGTSRGLRMCLATNGTLVDEAVCAKIKESGIRMVSLSLDGSRREVHDDFRKQPGAFDGVMRAIEHFKRSDIPFLINSSFTRRNQAEIPRVYRLAKELGATAWYLFMVVPTGRGEEILEELIQAPDYEEILSWHYEQERSETEILMRPTCAPQYYRIWLERSKKEGRSKERRNLTFSTGVFKGCLAGQVIAFIDRNGEVMPCSYFPHSAGNVRREPFREIWERSPLFLSLRDTRTYKGKCGSCEYLDVCGGCRARAAAVHSGDWLAEEPLCGYIPLRKRKKAAPGPGGQ